MNTMTRRRAQPFAPIRLIEPNFRGVRHLGIRIAVLTFALGTGLTPTWAQGLGVSLPATVASTITQGSSPNFADTYVMPFVATQGLTISSWKAQFEGGSVTAGCVTPMGIQLKILRQTASNTLTVISAGTVFNPLALLRARFNTTGCPSFASGSSSAVLQFTDSGLAVSAGDIIGVTVMSDPNVNLYFLPLASVSGNTRFRLHENTPVGGTIDLSSSFTGTFTGLAPTLQINGTTIYVSTFSGNQILKIFDSSPAAITVVNTDSTRSPEGIVVGPEGKLYVCDALNNVIRRIDPGSSPATVETVYNFSLTTGSTCNGGPCPSGPEAPSFSTLGDLYFNTRSPNHTGVWKIPKAQLNPLPTSGTTTPANVVPAACASSSNFCDNNSTWGEGTVFDLTDRLLFVDRSGGNVWRFNGSVSPPSLQQLISGQGTGMLIGIDVDPTSGDIFVGSFTVPGSILRFDSNGMSKGAYVTAGTTGGFAAGDQPTFIKFDASGRLLVGTATASETSGKLWRVDPPVAPSTTGTATLVAALPAPPCNSSCPPPAPPVVGVGIGSTSSSTTQPFNRNGGTITFARPTYDYKYVYPATTCTTTNPVNIKFTFLETTDAEWSQRVQGTSFAGTSLIHYAGTGGYGIVGRVEFFDATTGSAVTCTTSGPYTVITDFKTANPSDIVNQGPGFLKAPLGTNAFVNIFTSYNPATDPTDTGVTDDGFSDFAAVIRVTGTAPTVTITTPPQDNTGTYLLNQSVPASYSCAGAFVLKCLGTVPNGSPIDTSSVGTKSFQVNTVVSSGPTAVKSDTYNVAFNTSGSCLLYDPTKAVKGGSVIPIKLQVCDANGIDLSNSSIVLHAVGVVKTSGTITTTGVVDAGSANPDSDFRFDSTLGPTGGYIFNLKTVDPSGAALTTGTYQLQFTITGDPTTHVAPFQVL